MAAVSPVTTRAATAPAVTAQVVAGAVVAANLVIVEVLFVDGGAGKNGVLTVAKFFGLHAALMMMFQLLLVARLPWLDRRIGMDRLTAWHRWVGFTLLWTVLTHAALVVLGYATARSDAPVPRRSSPGRGGRLAARDVRRGDHRRGRRSSRSDTPAGGCRTRPGTPCTSLLYVAIGAGVRSTSCWRARPSPPRRRRASTGGRCGRWCCARCWSGRIGCRVWRNAYHRFRVAAVVPESDDVGVGVRHRPSPRQAARRGRASSASGGSPGTTAGGRRTRSRCRRRPTAARCGSPPRRSARPAPACATCRSAAASSSRARTARSPRCTRRPGALLIAGGVGITPIRALLEERTGPGASCSTGCAARPTPCCSASCRSWPASRGAAARADRADRQPGSGPPVRRRPTSPRWSPTSPTATCTSAARPR